MISDRPNLKPGVTTVPVLGGPNQSIRYFDPTLFALPSTGFYGDLGRNTMIAPGVALVDASLTKVFPVHEGVNLDFRTEFFNLLNRANFGLPGNQLFNANGTIQGNAGVINTTTTTSRQIQFGLKLRF